MIRCAGVWPVIFISTAFAAGENPPLLSAPSNGGAANPSAGALQRFGGCSLPVMGDVRFVAFSPDGEQLAIATGDHRGGAAQIGDLVSEKRFLRPFAFRQVFFSNDSRLLMLLDSPVSAVPQIGQSKIDAWEIVSGNLLAELPLPDEVAVSAAVSTDGRHLALGFASGLIRGYDFSSVAKPLSAVVAGDESLSLADLWNHMGSADPRVAWSAVMAMCRQPDDAACRQQDLASNCSWPRG